jgi:dihydroxyacetone kinase-like protein
MSAASGEIRSPDEETKRRLVRSIAGSVIDHCDELTALDAAIGDGDHGHNMKRGFMAVLADMDSLATVSLPKLLEAIGTKLVMTVGGASGPLYGTLFRALGQALPEHLSREGVAAAFVAAISAVRARGKSEAGQKTMLDVLIPVTDAFAAGAELAELRNVAELSAKATTPMRATRGRASFLGERSIGHMDPGARSAWLMIAAACDAWEKA